MVSLIWMNLKSYFSLSVILDHARKRDAKLLAMAGILLAIVVSVAPLVYYYWRILDVLHQNASLFGQPQLVLTFALLSCTMLVVFLGATYVLSVFYFSNDLSLLVPLPLHPYQVLAAKTIVVWVSELMITAPFFWPAIFLYGAREGTTAWFYVGAIIVYLLLPLAPIALVTVFIMAIMGASNLSRNKDTIRLAGMFLMVIAIVVGMGLITRVPPGQEEELIRRILTEEEGLVVQAARVYPPALWGTRALQIAGGQQLAYLGLLAVSSLGLMAASVLSAQRWFYAGLIGAGEIAARSVMKAGAYRRFVRAGSPITAIMYKEMKMLVRTPIYLFNSVGMIILLPVLLLIPMVMSPGGLNLELVRGIVAEQPALTQMGAIGFIAIMAMLAPGSSSSFSREGKHFWIAKTMPVHPREQVLGRVAQGYWATGWVLPLVMAFGLGIAGWPLTSLAVVVVIGLLVSLPLILANLLIDLSRPYLTWENPQQAIKQNLNVLFGMVIGGAILYGQGYLVSRLWQGGHPVFVIMLAIAATAMALGTVLYAILHQVASRLYDRISP